MDTVKQEPQDSRSNLSAAPITYSTAKSKRQHTAAGVAVKEEDTRA